MGLLNTTQKAGLLNKTLPVLPGTNLSANTTQQLPFQTSEPVAPNAPVLSPTAETRPLRTPTLTGSTTLSQGKTTALDKIKSKLPNNFVGDVTRGVLDAPKIIAQEAGFLDEDKIVKLDRIAQSLIEDGTDSTRAYEIAGAELSRKETTKIPSKQQLQSYKDLNITPEESKAMRSAKIANDVMTSLIAANYIPAGGITKNIGQKIANIAASKDTAVITKELIDIGIPKEKVGTLATVLTDVSKPEVVSKVIEDAIVAPKPGLLNKSEIPLGKKNEYINGNSFQDREALLRDVIKPQIDNLPKPNKDEVLVFHNTPNGKLEPNNFVSTDPEQMWMYADKNTIVKVVKKDDLVSTGIPEKDAFGERVYVGRPTTRTAEELAAGKERLAKRLQEIPKKKPAQGLSQEDEDFLSMLKAEKESLENTGFKNLQKFESKTGEFKGQLNINNGTGEFARTADTRLRELFNDVNNRYDSEELIAKYEDLKDNYKRVNEQIDLLEKKRKTPQVEIAPEKGASVVSQGEATRLQVPTKYEGEVRSLPDIVERTTTNVKDKVNVLDYLRTPDRVLEKIGFGKEAKMVREGYEKYVKELPKNIDKITEWSKQVPKESNERIFKYLDGQKIALDAKETKVATEIKAWLKDWAQRLKLPEDNQITHYITHIFDRELIAKEFDEDLAKLITDRLPGQVYDPFLEKRLGALGYKQDTWAALDAYVKRATRKVNMDDALEAIKSKAGSTLEFSNIEASQFKYIQRYINNVNMRPTELDNLIDNTLKSIFGYKYGTRPVTYITKLLRQMTFRGMLGINPGSALRNLSQGINTYAKLGEKYTTIGYAKLFSPSGRQEIIDSGILADTFIQDRNLNATKKALETIDKGLFAMFDLAEKINRGAAFLGAKSKALAQGMSEEQAVNYAKKIVRDTQFNFGSIDTPVALQNDIVKTLTQFQTFTVKQIEFLTEMAKDKNFVGLLRYAVGGLLFVYTIGKAFNMTLDQLIPTFRFDTPPSLKLPVEATKAALNTPDKYGQERTLEKKASDIGKSAIGLIPGGTQIKKTVEGEEFIRKGGSFDKGGNLQYEAPTTTKGKVQALLFGKYSGEEAQKYFDKPDQNKKDLEEIKPFYEQIQQLKKEGKEQEAVELYDGLSDKGKQVYKKYKSQVKSEETKAGKEKILPVFREIRKLKESGNTEEALKMYEALSDQEKEYYQLLKKQLTKPKSEEITK